MTRPDPRRTAALLERIGRLIGTDAHASDLQPVQWEALRYLSRANRFSRHGAALTAFLGSTKGTVSQTVKALESKGLLRNRADPKDRRRNRLSLTAKGRRLLEQDPIEAMTAAIRLLPASTLSVLDDGLARLLSARLDASGRQPFGQCRDCVHFAHEHDDGQPHFCTLLGEPLSAADSQAICVEQRARR